MQHRPLTTRVGTHEHTGCLHPQGGSPQPEDSFSGVKVSLLGFRHTAPTPATLSILCVIKGLNADFFMSHESYEV